jgi:4,5-dihydroxyphthalate decarboxylase
MHSSKMRSQGFDDITGSSYDRDHQPLLEKAAGMLNLKVGVTKNPRFEPLIDGAVKSAKCNLAITVTTPPELFYRNLKNDEFGVFEMSISEFLITRERSKGDRWQWCALPIFPAKAFVWLGLYINMASGIHTLADLRGKRVGVPDYVMTAALWFRVFLRELHGIEPNEISWFIGRTKDLSHGGLLNIDARPPADVSLTWLTAEETFDKMLDRGEIDTAYGFAPRHDPKLFSLNIDRYGGTPLEGNPRIGKLFADGGCAVIQAFFQKTGVVPANHVIVAQRRLVDQNPWLAAEVLQLFAASKQTAYERNNFGSPAYLYFESLRRAEQTALYGDDPFPFGIAKNRRMLEMLFRSSHEQGLTQNRAKIEEVFYPALLDT